MDEKKLKAKARKAAEAILSDLSDRGGIGNALDEVDDGIKKEIKDMMVAEILRVSSED